VNKRRASAATLLAAVTAVAGCSSSGGGGSDHGSTGAAAKGDPASASDSPTRMLTPTASAASPLGAGQRAWAAFSARGLTQGDWWAQLRPQLSDSARAVYRYDDPRNIPTMKLTDSVQVAPKPPAEPRYTAEVIVPTNKGDFRLDLERHKLRSRWLLYAIKFPPGVQ
jgi:hypothetical protein